MADLTDVIVDDSDSIGGNSEAARKALTEAVTAPTNDAGSSSANTGQEDDSFLPEKLRGKSKQQIAEMYQNLESVNGRMANDLGVQRQLTDRILGMKREDDLRANGGTAQRAKPAPVTTNDLLDRPQETLERVVNDKVDSISETLRRENQQLRAEVAKARFETRHANYQQTVSDPAFMDWIKASPLRMRAAAVANGGDWQIADELFTEYEQHSTSRRQSSTQNTEQPTETRETNLSDARKATYTSSGSNSNDGQARPGKIYKRADLMKLMIEDPETYYEEGFQAEILRAHAEKRVR